MKLRHVLAFTALFALGLPAAADAASLAVSPVIIQVNAPSKTAVVSVTNSGTTPVNAQFRVFKWAIQDGQDQLIPTKDVVVSPPMAKLTPDQLYVVRVIRTSKAPIESEETYRLVVDEIPNAKVDAKQMGPRFALRQVLPVFFTPPGSQPAITWQARMSGSKLVVTANNAGDRRLRLTSVRINSGPSSAKPVQIAGLSYVFANSTREWSKDAKKKLVPGSPVIIKADSEDGPIETTVSLEAAK